MPTSKYVQRESKQAAWGLAFAESSAGALLGRWSLILNALFVRLRFL